VSVMGGVRISMATGQLQVATKVLLCAAPVRLTTMAGNVNILNRGQIFGEDISYR